MRVIKTLILTVVAVLLVVASPSAIGASGSQVCLYIVPGHVQIPAPFQVDGQTVAVDVVVGMIAAPIVSDGAIILKNDTVLDLAGLAKLRYELGPNVPAAVLIKIWRRLRLIAIDKGVVRPNAFELLSTRPASCFNI